MSSRRGRGRGGRGSASREFLKRSAAEVGADATKVIDEIVHPRFYPDFRWRSSGGLLGDDDDDVDTEQSIPLAKTKRPVSLVKLLNKQREMTSRRQASPHFLSSNKSLSDGYTINTTIPDREVLNSFSSTNRKLATDERYFPAELLRSNDAVAVPVSSLSSRLVLNDAESDEGSEDELKEEIDLDLAEATQEEDFEEALDYTTNYYNTDDEDNDSDGAEPTF